MEMRTLHVSGSCIMYHVSCIIVSGSRVCYTAKYAHLMRAVFPALVRVFTLPEVSCLLELAPQLTLLDPTHIGGFILM